MFCGKCGNDDKKNYIRSGIVANANDTYYYSIGKCTRCGELLGTKEIYTFDHCETMSREEVKKMLEWLENY